MTGGEKKKEGEGTGYGTRTVVAAFCVNDHEAET